MALNDSIKILKVTLSFTGSQCKDRKTGVMWSYLSYLNVLVINQAATQMLQSNWLTHCKRSAIRSISARWFDLSDKIATFSRLFIFLRSVEGTFRNEWTIKPLKRWLLEGHSGD